MPTGCMLVALACLAGTAGASTLGGAGIEARVDAIERKFVIELGQAEDRMSNELKEMRVELGRMEARLDSCETDTATTGHAVAVIEGRRRVQEAARCQGEGMQTMLTACCPAGGGGRGGQHRRGLQGGCSGFPASCSAECAELFVEYYEVCQDTIALLLADQKVDFDNFFGQCSEADQGMAGMMQPVQVQMFRVRLSTEAGQDQTDMFPGGGGATQPVGPVGPAAC